MPVKPDMVEVQQLSQAEVAAKEEVVDAVAVEFLHLGPQDHQDLTANQAAMGSQAVPETTELQDHPPQAKAVDQVVFHSAQPAHRDQQEILDKRELQETLAHRDKMFKAEAKDHPDHQDPLAHQEAQEMTVHQVNQELQDKFMKDQPFKAHQDPLDPQDKLAHQDQEETMVNQATQADKDHPEMLAVQVDPEAQEAMDSPVLLVNLAVKDLVRTVLPRELPLAIKRHLVPHGIPDFSIEFMAFYCIPLLFIKNVYSIQIT
jgi:hypothetical protein